METLNPGISFIPLACVLLALQFAAFGWRINREISVGDEGRTTWLPVPDIINILSMVSVVWFCVVWPLSSGQFSKESRAVLSAAFVVMAFHPICMVGHYGLFSRRGREARIKSKDDDFQYCPWPEGLCIILQLFFAIAVGRFVYLAKIPS